MTQVIDKTNINYSAELHSVIPGGAHTYSRGDDQFSPNAPSILHRGKGAYVWDQNNNKFLDYGMGLRAITIGYANDEIDNAAIEQIRNGTNLTRATLIELEAAKKITSLIPCAQMVKFAKNGSNVTTAAAKVARAYTKKEYICIPRQHPFFSFDDWFIGTTPIKKGIPPRHYQNTLVFDYGDIDSLRQLFVEYQDNIAAVMLEPVTAQVPGCEQCEGLYNGQYMCSSCSNVKQHYLNQVRDLCTQNQSLLIFDEMITGFRWHLKGAQHYFGVTPDLATFGKGMSNGYALAALVGKQEYMQVGAINIPDMERTFILSSTHGAEMPALGAFCAVIDFYQKNNVTDHLWAYGTKLKESVNNISAELGLTEFFQFVGPAINLNYQTLDKDKKVSLAFRTLFQQELVKQNILMPWVAVSYAHQDAELKQTLEAVYNALIVYKQALTNGIETYLNGPSIKPVFRQYN